MIKIFKNIRKNLINQDKTARYFKYAIGEIILVVIGILIALQINNWNETRKSNNRAYSYLQRLNEDIENVSKQVAFSVDDIERKQKYAMMVLKALEERELPASKREDFERYLKQYYQFQITIQNVNTFNEMMSSGDINLIKNKWLRNEFSNLSSHREFVMNVNQTNHNAYKFNPDLFQKHVRYHVEHTDTDSTKVATIYYFNAMANDSLFVNLISSQANTWYEMSRMYKAYQSQVKKIHDTIQVELNKYKL